MFKFLLCSATEPATEQVQGLQADGGQWNGSKSSVPGKYPREGRLYSCPRRAVGLEQSWLFSHHKLLILPYFLITQFTQH